MYERKIPIEMCKKWREFKYKKAAETEYEYHTLSHFSMVFDFFSPWVRFWTTLQF
jgi:hypothetical protein